MSTKDSPTTQLRRCTMQALFAVVAMGGKFHDAHDVSYNAPNECRKGPLAEHVKDMPAYKGRVITDTKAAWKAGAYFIERPWLGRNGSGSRYGWRLCSYSKTSQGGHSYSGETFKTADDFWAAMRTVVDLAEMKGRK